MTDKPMVRGEAMIAGNLKKKSVRLVKVEELIAGLPAGKFKEISHLAKFVSEKLGCHHTVYLRKTQPYYEVLNDYINAGASGPKPPTRSAVKDKRLRLELEVGELTAINKALEAQLREAYTKLSSLEHAASGSNVDQIIREQEDKIDEEACFKVLQRVISTSGGFKTDERSGFVIDELNGQITFDEKELPRYFKWLRGER